MMNYRPRDMAMWDTWYIEHDGKVHMYYLQRIAPGATRNQSDEDWIGHAVSEDLIHWEERSLALPPGETGSLDDMQPWTGCVYKCGDKFHMYFTMRSTRDGGAGQHIGLAISDDLDNWVRYPGNPIISPDKRWYIGHHQPLFRGTVDCRDLIIARDDANNRWLGFYAARIPAKEMAESSVVAMVQSTDLVHWEHLPPAFVPEKYACIEVPDVYEMNGRWYLTCLTGNSYGNRGIYTDPNCTHGTIYAVAERPEGPYKEIEGDNVLIGGYATCGYSCRTIEFQGERYLFYTEPSLISGITDSTVSPPMVLRTTADGGLRPYYSPRTQGWRTKTLIEQGEVPPVKMNPYCHPAWALTAGTWEASDGVYRGSSRTGWQTGDIAEGTLNFEMEATVKLESGSACGLVFRPDRNLDFTGTAMVFGLDVESQNVFASYLTEFNYLGKRNRELKHGQPYHIRACVRRPRVEVFVDDELVLQFAASFPESPAPALGLFVDRGVAEIRDVAAYQLG
ncbi:MAG: glycoside hydrolase family protein [Armatimonadota bacterium]